MTMGPAPISRIDSMSVRLGISRPPQPAPRSRTVRTDSVRPVLVMGGGRSGIASAVHQIGEEVEQVAGVVRAGPGLGVVLDAEGPLAFAADALDHPVVEVPVGDLDALAQTVGRDRVVVVLAGDL